MGRAAGLSDEGRNMLRNLKAGDAPAFCPTGALEFNAGGGPRVLAVSLFDGIGALVCALVRLPVQVVGYARAELDKECKCVSRRRSPGIIERAMLSTSTGRSSSICVESVITNWIW